MRSVAIGVLLLCALSCSGNKNKDNENISKETESSVAVSLPAEETVEASVEKIVLKAEVTDKETTLSPFEIILNRTASGKLTGETVVDGVSAKLVGSLREKQLRLWVLGGKDGAKNRRCGIVTGTLAPNGGNGTFAISGSGGVPRFKGTWVRK